MCIQNEMYVRRSSAESEQIPSRFIRSGHRQSECAMKMSPGKDQKDCKDGGNQIHRNIAISPNENLPMHCKYCSYKHVGFDGNHRWVFEFQLCRGLLTCPARETFLRSWNIIITSIMAKTASLDDIPADISKKYLSYIPTHASSCKGQYLHSIKIFRNEEKLIDIAVYIYIYIDKGKNDKTYIYIIDI